MKRWRCSVCGYVQSGERPPDVCPNCSSPKEKFGEIPDDFEELQMHYEKKVSRGKEVEVNPFFGDYSGISPYVYNLPAGQRVPLHKHPTTDELFFVLKGKLEFKVGDKKVTAAEGDVVKGKMNVPHTFANIGKEAAAFLSVKGPKPVDLVKLEEA
ncbi:MAG: cupin domain-containing protein [Candidatus Eiseniibacteriota bacterium]|nr:MAG: cupin domain-containing protein [Candidatus Eisenbacteria bacterium]